MYYFHHDSLDESMIVISKTYFSIKLRNTASIKFKIMHSLPHTWVFTFCSTVPAQKLQIQRLSGRKLLCREITFYNKHQSQMQYKSLPWWTTCNAFHQNMKAFYNIILALFCAVSNSSMKPTGTLHVNYTDLSLKLLGGLISLIYKSEKCHLPWYSKFLFISHRIKRA